MSDFKHSIVLFCGEDGLPLEFNVRNTEDKDRLKALIEYGGGFVSQNENAVHLISPGTKVLNADMGKKLVSTSYIYDCVKENYLLDVDEYVFVVSEAHTSDISDEDSEKMLAMRHSTGKFPEKSPSKAMDIAMSPIKAVAKTNDTGSTTASNLTLPSSSAGLPQASTSSSTNSESFIEGTQDASSVFKITSHVFKKNELEDSNYEAPLIAKGADKLGGWEISDFQSQSLVSPAKSSHTEKEMSLCSSLDFKRSDNSSSNSSVTGKSPAKSNLKIDLLKKLTTLNKNTFDVDNQNDADIEKDFVLKPQLEFTKNRTEGLINSPLKTSAMDMDVSLMNASFKLSPFKSPLKVNDEKAEDAPENELIKVDNSMNVKFSNVKEGLLIHLPDYPIRLSVSPVKNADVEQIKASPFKRNLLKDFNVSPSKRNIDAVSPSKLNFQSVSPSNKNFNDVSPLKGNFKTMSSTKRNFETALPLKSDFEIVSPSKRNFEIASPLKTNFITASPSKQNDEVVSPLKRNIEAVSLLQESIETVSSAQPPPAVVSPPHPCVTSSQPEDDGLDNFDKELLSKAQKKAEIEAEEDSLSQSYTVSSSADAQVASLPGSAEVNPPVESNSAPLPDSPSLSATEVNIELYKKNLESEVQKILKKERPLSILDKATLVKYICITRHFSPREALESLLTNCSDS